MEKYKLLSASHIVNIGATKADISLPDTGVKEITPNGSWLEQKQIQSALEARKGLIGIERIEKSGSLSHAKWREDLMLAEVTQKVGGYWNYVGHNVGRQLFLYPEEALYLMESNCILLKYNDVPVSLQQAYAMLLSEKVTILQYKVYSFLSRLGCKVFRHKNPTSENCSHSLTGNGQINDQEKYDAGTSNAKISDDLEIINYQKLENHDNADNSHVEHLVSNSSSSNSLNMSLGQFNSTISEVCESDKQNLLRKTKYSRIFSICDIQHKNKYFNDIPDIIQKGIVTVKTPEKQYVPQNTIVNIASYTVNLENIKNKPANRSSLESRSYSISDEVNGSHVRRIRNHSADFMTFNTSQNNGNPSQFLNCRVPFRSDHSRPFHFWRVPPSFNYLQFRLLFQRPFTSNFLPRFQLFPRLYPNYTTNINTNHYYRNEVNNSRKRTRDLAKSHHLAEIKNLAARLRMFLCSGSTQQDNVDTLQRIINTFNVRYKTNIQLNEHLDVIDETITETIELDDDDTSRSKKPRLIETSDCYNENIAKLKQLSNKLKYLEVKGVASAAHRRALSNAVKTFNNSYKADIYINHNYEIIDKRLITLDSSDSDCILDETPVENSKKLWNPFSGLKIISNNQLKLVKPCTSETEPIRNNETLDDYNKYYELTSNFFNKNWLPGENDFGRPEVISKNLINIRLLDTAKESFLYEFLKNQHCKYNNWLEVKTAFYQNLKMTSKFEKEAGWHSPLTNCLLKPEDYTNMDTLLKKLSIIKTEIEVAPETSLSIDFDVYKDVHNFKKTNRPNPQFRIVCLCESSGVPNGVEIATLHSKYEDSVTIIFAIVGTNSVSFLQMNPTELPLYIPSNVS